MSAYSRSDASRNLSVQIDRDRLDSGSGPGVLKLYTAPRPAIKGAAITTQTLLCVCTFSDPSAPDAVDGVLTFNPVTAGAILEPGQPAWARSENADGLFVADMDVGLVGSGAPVQINDLNLNPSVPIEVGLAKITAGNA